MDVSSDKEDRKKILLLIFFNYMCKFYIRCIIDTFDDLCLSNLCVNIHKLYRATMCLIAEDFSKFCNELPSPPRLVSYNNLLLVQC